MTAVPTGPTIDRRSYLGASEIAAVAGLHPWSSPLDVWAAKTGRKTDDLDSMAAMIGRELERPILEKLYAPTAKVVLGYPGTLRDAEESWAAASPDAIALPDVAEIAPPPLVDPDVIRLSIESGKAHGVECKVVGFNTAHRWRDPMDGEDQPPPDVVMQCQWQMRILGPKITIVKVPALFGTEFKVYTVKRDDEMIEALIGIGRKFWHEHVLADVPPDTFVGSKSESDLIRDLFPQKAPLRGASAEEIQLAEDYHRASAEARAADREKQRIAAALKMAIGESEGVDGGPTVKATWKTQKGRVDYKAHSEGLLSSIGETLGFVSDGDITTAQERLENALAWDQPRLADIRTLRVNVKRGA